MLSNSYQTELAWKQIQSYLPEENRIDAVSSPTEEFLAFQRFDIHIDRYQQEHPKGIVVIFHGVGGNGRLLEFIALPLWRAGYQVICPDLPLYGLTRYRGSVTYGDWVDVGVAVCTAYRWENLPLFVFGLSAGGMLAYQISCTPGRFDGLMATCFLDQRIKRVTEETASGKLTAIIGKPFLKMTHKLLGPLKLPMKAFCNMRAIVNNDALAGILMRDSFSSGAKVSLSFLYGMLYQEIVIEAKDFQKCPVLLAHPEEDHWTHPDLSRLFFDQLPAEKEFVLLPGAGHFPIEPIGLSELEKTCIEFLNRISDNKAN